MDKFAHQRIATFFYSSTFTLLMIAIFGGGGYLLDQKLNTFPTLMVTGIVVSAPLTQWFLYRKFKSLDPNNLN